VEQLRLMAVGKEQSNGITRVEGEGVKVDLDYTPSPKNKICCDAFQFVFDVIFDNEFHRAVFSRNTQIKQKG
jgi:hypothetical protein